MQPAIINKELVSLIVTEIEKSQFHKDIQIQLGITDVNYTVGQENFVNYGPEVKARSFVSVDQHNVNRVSRIVFYIEAIVDLVNARFSKLTGDGVIEEVARIVVMFLFTHELMHVQQFEQGLTIGSYRQIHYADNHFENEANQYARALVGSDGVFQQEIVTILTDPRYQMQGDENIRLINVYNDQYRS